MDVPLSKMKSLDCLRVDVDLPFTVMPVDWRYQVLPPCPSTDAYVRLPVNLVVSIPPKVISAVLPLAFGVRYRLNMAVVSKRGGLRSARRRRHEDE